MDLTVTHGDGSGESFKGLRRKRESSSEKDEEKDHDHDYSLLLPIPAQGHKSDDVDNDDEDHDSQIIGVNKAKFPPAGAVSFPEDSAFLTNDIKPKSSSSSAKRKKNFSEYYQNSKQRFETFKKSGGSIALQCKRLREKTNCKIYYKAEYISVSGRRMCHWYGFDFSEKDKKGETMATEQSAAPLLVPGPVPGSGLPAPVPAPAHSQLIQLPPSKSPTPTPPSSSLGAPLPHPPPPPKLPLPLPLLSPAPKLIQSGLSPSQFAPLPLPLVCSSKQSLVLPSPPSHKYPNPSSIETCLHCKRQDVIGPDLKIIETGWAECRGGDGPCSSRVHNDCLGFPGTKKLPDYYCPIHMIYGRRNERVHSYYP